MDKRRRCENFSSVSRTKSPWDWTHRRIDFLPLLLVIAGHTRGCLSKGAIIRRLMVKSYLTFWKILDYVMAWRLSGRFILALLVFRLMK